MDLDEAIKGRYSVRRFSTKKPDWRNIIECIDAARFAPMAGNNFTLKFIVVDDAEKIQEIAEASQQDFIKQAHYVVVVCSDISNLVNAYEERGKIFARQQAGAAIENFLLKITEAGLSTCWIGYFVEEQVKRTLKIPGNVQVEALFPLGFEFPKRYTKKVKINLDNILYFNIYKNKKMKPPKKLEV